MLRDRGVHLTVYWLIKSGSYSGFKVNVKGLILKSASALYKDIFYMVFSDWYMSVNNENLCIIVFLLIVYVLCEEPLQTDFEHETCVPCM